MQKEVLSLELVQNSLSTDIFLVLAVCNLVLYYFHYCTMAPYINAI